MRCSGRRDRCLFPYLCRNTRSFCFLQIWLITSLSCIPLIQIIFASWVYNMSQKLYYILSLLQSLSDSCQEPALKGKVNIPGYSRSLIWFHFQRKLCQSEGVREVYLEISFIHGNLNAWVFIIFSLFRQTEIPRRCFNILNQTVCFIFRTLSDNINLLSLTLQACEPCWHLKKTWMKLHSWNWQLLSLKFEKADYIANNLCDLIILIDLVSEKCLKWVNLYWSYKDRQTLSCHSYRGIHEMKLMLQD